MFLTSRVDTRDISQWNYVPCDRFPDVGSLHRSNGLLRNPNALEQRQCFLRFAPALLLERVR
jgi:hypothetical protein